MQATRPAFAIKAEVHALDANAYVFPAQKTMYGGKHIRAGDLLFLFASENEGGHGLFARGIVSQSKADPRRNPEGRETPRVSIAVSDLVFANAPLGRAELRTFTDWDDGRPESELNFKFYRQATNKIVGINESTAAFLNVFFPASA